MSKKTILSIVISLLAINLFAQYAPKWHKTIGTQGNQIAESVIQISDGNFLLVGNSSVQSSSNSDNYSPYNSKLLLVKLDDQGNKIWETFIGLGKNNFGNSVAETHNGDFIVVGASNDKNGGMHDLWVVRVNANGEFLWEQKFGGLALDEAYSIKKTADNGFIVSGLTESKGNGDADMWLLRFDRWGQLLWEKTYGNSGYEEARSVIESANGDFIIAGSTTTTSEGKKDISLIRVNSAGTEIWSKKYGYEFNDLARQEIETNNGDIVLVGTSASNNGQKTSSIAIRTNPRGEVIWEKQFGESNRNIANSVVELRNNELVIAGSTSSTETGYDVELVLLDEYGDQVWQQVYGGIRWDEAFSIIQSDENLLFTGYTKSYLANQSDIWTLMLEPDITPQKIETPEIIPSEQIYADVDENIPQSIMNGRNKVAIIIGIEDYKYTTKAKFAAHDALVFYKYAKSIFGIADENILLMTNAEATSAEFNKAFMEGGWLESKVDAETEIIIYYAGHAITDNNPSIKEAYLVPSDVDPNYADISGIGINELVYSLGKLNARSSTLFFDACYTNMAGELAYRNVINTKIVYNTKTNILFATDKDEPAIPLTNQNHGLFTYYLLKGLSGEAAGIDNKITINELHQYIRANVSKQAQNLKTEQTPQMYSDEKNKILVEF